MGGLQADFMYFKSQLGLREEAAFGSCGIARAYICKKLNIRANQFW